MPANSPQSLAHNLTRYLKDLQTPGPWIVTSAWTYKTFNMEKQQPKDKHLDTPSAANEEKHINFLAEEERAQSVTGGIDTQRQENEERKKEWQEGIEAGKRNDTDDPHFEKRDLDEQEEY